MKIRDIRMRRLIGAAAVPKPRQPIVTDIGKGLDLVTAKENDRSPSTGAGEECRCGRGVPPRGAHEAAEFN